MTSFVEIYSPFLEKIFFVKKFYHIWTWGPIGCHFGHVTLIIYIHLGSPFLQMLHIKFGFDWPSYSKEQDGWILW